MGPFDYTKINNLGISPEVLQYLNTLQTEGAANDQTLNRMNSPAAQMMLSKTLAPDTSAGNMAAYAKGGAQLGTMGGKVADTSAVADNAKVLGSADAQRIRNVLTQYGLQKSALDQSNQDLADQQKNMMQFGALQNKQNMLGQELDAKKEMSTTKLDKPSFKPVGFDAAGHVVNMNTNTGEMINTGMVANKAAPALADNKELAAEQAAFNKDAIVVEAQKKLNQATANDKEIEDAKTNPVTRNALKLGLARMIVPSRLNETEIAAFGGSQAIMQRSEQIAQDLSSGTLSEDNYNYMKRFVQGVKDSAQNDLQNQTFHYAKQFSKRTGKPINDSFALISGDSAPSGSMPTDGQLIQNTTLGNPSRKLGDLKQGPNGMMSWDGAHWIPTTAAAGGPQ